MRDVVFDWLNERFGCVSGFDYSEIVVCGPFRNVYVCVCDGGVSVNWGFLICFDSPLFFVDLERAVVGFLDG